MIGGQPDSLAVDRSVEFWSAADPEKGNCDPKERNCDPEEAEVVHPEGGEVADPEKGNCNPKERNCDPELANPEVGNPEEKSCVLNDYPRSMGGGPTANLVSGQLVACYGPMCEIYIGGEWNRLVATREIRFYHTSAVNGDRILLIGGLSRSTEWIPVDGSPSQPGPFEVRHGQNHCTVQLSPDTIVVTGGFESEEYVTEYQLTGDATETALTSMKYGGRSYHACAAYMDGGGNQVIF